MPAVDRAASREPGRGLRAAPQQKLLEALNPVISGRAQYHRHVVSQETFSQVDSQIGYALWQWARRRHPKKRAAWVRERYFHRIGLRRWVFAVERPGPDGQPSLLSLRTAASTPIQRHPKVQSDANPRDRAWHAYFKQRAAIRRRVASAAKAARGGLLAMMQVPHA